MLASLELDLKGHQALASPASCLEQLQTQDFLERHSKEHQMMGSLELCVKACQTQTFLGPCLS